MDAFRLDASALEAALSRAAGLAASGEVVRLARQAAVGAMLADEELTALYGNVGVTPDKDVIAYCRIGERSSHTWFVLTNLLGYPQVRNYDGSWTEWGNSVGVPIEK